MQNKRWLKTVLLFQFLSITFIQQSNSFSIIENSHTSNTLNKVRKKKFIPDTKLFKDIHLSAQLEKVKNHVLGKLVLSTSDFESIRKSININSKLFVSDFKIIAFAFEIIELYENKNGALFTKGTTTLGGYKRNASGYEIEKMILLIMQTVLDNSYTEANLKKKPSLFNNTFFKTSSYFPGPVTPPSDSSVNYTVKINGTHVRKPGTQANYENEDARRPTGCYLAPGSIAKVTVPSSLIGIGATILVGVHTWDLSKKPIVKRMDRVTIKYDINTTTTTIANPLGGGIYINIPYKNDLGILNIKLENIIRSPYFANTVANKTSLKDWQNVERHYKAPWTDFETDKIMIQIPTSWVSNFNNPKKALDDWDMAMDAISELLGRPLIRSKTVIYAQVDVISRGKANFPGYPQSNVSYNPYRNYGGYYNHYLVNGPRNERGHLINVLFHEQGHAEKIYKFKGEIESFVNFLWVPVYNKKFGVELNKAFEESFSAYGLQHSIEEAAVSWMITENFRLGNQMSTTRGNNRHEFSYQPRGHAKYADLVRLFGWHSIESFYKNTSELYENGKIDYSKGVNKVPTDDRLLRMSIAAGYDLRPLIHFWGIQPNNFDDLNSKIENKNLKKSTAIYDQLSYYKKIVPMDNDAFRNFGLEDFTETKIANSTFFESVSQSYNTGFYKKWWNSYGNTEAKETINQIDKILNLYFPEGRPEEDNNSCIEIKPKNTKVITLNNVEKTKENEESIIYDLGVNYNLCDIQISFENKVNNFDIEVSRNNQTFLAVKQNLSSSKTSNTFDDYSISRKARYVKIIFKGNEFNNWKSVREIKFYAKK